MLELLEEGRRMQGRRDMVEDQVLTDLQWAREEVVRVKEGLLVVGEEGGPSTAGGCRHVPLSLSSSASSAVENGRLIRCSPCAI